MAYVKLNKQLSTEIAHLFGPKITLMAAEKAVPIMREFISAGTVDDRHHAIARADLSDRVSIETHRVEHHHQVVLSVKGRNIPEIASFLEFGYTNVRAKRHMEGLHAARNTAIALKV